MKKWACEGISDLMRGTWNKSCIEFRNIHVGRSGPAHRSSSRMRQKMAAMTVSVTSEVFSIYSLF